MKRIFFTAFVMLFFFPAFTAEQEMFKDNQPVLDSILAGITVPEKPRIQGDYIVFTADTAARHTGIAFDFENYCTVHSFKRITKRDHNEKPISSVLFYILKIPQKISKISYRLVIDGLWTTDPKNHETVFNAAINLPVSTVSINRTQEIRTEHTNQNMVCFIYEGRSGQKIRLGGSFTNWDPFIYELGEIRPGFYQIELPLPKGTHYYAFYTGISAFIDEKNPAKAYTSDGRIASVINVR